MGRMIAVTGEIPGANLFLYTLPADQPFFDQPWLGQWGMYRLLAFGGHAGLVVCRNLITALTWTGLLLAALGRCRDPRMTGGYLLLIAAVTAPIFGVRTQMFAFIPYVCLVASLLAVADGRWSRRWLWGLLPMTALWANVHGTFVLAPVLVALTGGALVVEEWLEEGKIATRRAGWWMGLTLAVATSACLTPFGPDVYVYVVELTFGSDLSSTVSEWRSPDPGEPFGLITLASILGSTLVLGVRRRSVQLYEAVLFGATAYLGLDAIRSLFWWGAIAALIVPRHLRDWLAPADWTASDTGPLLGAAHALAAGGLIIGAVLAQPGWPVFRAASTSLEGYARRSGEGSQLLNYENATELVDRIAARDEPGQIFHAQALGGLIDYKIGAADPHTPRASAFLDQRMALLPERVWDDYFTISQARRGWRQKLESYDVDRLILSPDEQWRLIQEVQVDPGWRLEAVGEAHLLFVRVDVRS